MRSILGDLERNKLERKSHAAGGCQRGSYARLRLIDCIRQKINAEFPIEPKRGGLLNRPNPTPLIERITILRIDLSENAGRGLTFRAPDKGFVPIDPPFLDIHDGLKRHCERRRRDLLAAASALLIFCIHVTSLAATAMRRQAP
jgi:hypothetical protein